MPVNWEHRRKRLAERGAQAHASHCPHCSAVPGEDCHDAEGDRLQVLHTARYKEVQS